MSPASYRSEDKRPSAQNSTWRLAPGSLRGAREPSHAAGSQHLRRRAATPPADPHAKIIAALTAAAASHHPQIQCRWLQPEVEEGSWGRCAHARCCRLLPPPACGRAQLPALTGPGLGRTLWQPRPPPFFRRTQLPPLTASGHGRTTRVDK